MIFFFDNTFSHYLPKMLAVYEESLGGEDHELKHLQDDFAEDTKDVVWLKEVANWNDVAILTMDGAIMKKRDERAMLSQTEHHVFVFAKGWSNQTVQEIAWKSVKIWPDIVERAERTRRSTVFDVTMEPKVQKACLTSEL